MSDIQFVASGKLLLFGEYLVLRGAKSIAIPLSATQSLCIEKGDTEKLHWICLQEEKLWFEALFDTDLSIISTSDKDRAEIVKNLLKLIKDHRPDLKIYGLSLRFQINFDRHYGFGTSSTLISLLSQWTNVDPYLLLEHSFGGSGYDIAAATAPDPFVYQAKGLTCDAPRTVSYINLDEQITSKLLFIYTGNKQDSRQQIALFQSVDTPPEIIIQMNNIVASVLSAQTIGEFEHLVKESETLIAHLLQAEPVGSKLFSDYPYQVKSLGAWGGDFIMATYRDISQAKQYFRNRGMYPIFSYSELIKK